MMRTITMTPTMIKRIKPMIAVNPSPSCVFSHLESSYHGSVRRYS